MEPMTLRTAAERSARSITTLRRYIRNGRLKADKRPGRFGPEYYVLDLDLEEAGLQASPREVSGLPSLAASTGGALERVLRDSVPLSLFHELQMKHEQLLVQYGMIRAGGLRVLELQAQVETQTKELDDCRAEMASARARYASESALLGRSLRQSELELEGRRMEIAALREKVRALELLTRNAVTTETIERKFVQVMEQANLVDRMRAEQDVDALPALSADDREIGPDH